MRILGDPTTCPACGGPATPTERCPRCAVRLRGDDARQVLRLLMEADHVVARMRDEAVGWRAVSAQSWAPGVPAARAVDAPRPAAAAPGSRTAVASPPAPPRVGPPMQPPMPRPAPPSPTAPSWSVGSILLALGALCLVVAAAVFVTVSWDRMGLGGRTAVLLGLTAAVTAAAAEVTRRRLRASAEALWAVAAGFVTLDYWAARAYGLIGIDRLSSADATLVFGVLLTGVGAGTVALARRWGAGRLVVGEVAAALGVAATMVGIADRADGSTVGCLGAALLGVLATGVALAARAYVAGIVSAVLTALTIAATTLLQAAELYDRALLSLRDAEPLVAIVGFVVVAGAAAAVATGLERMGRRAFASVVVPTSVVLAVLHVALLPLTWALAAPAVDDHVLAASIVLAVLAVVLAGAAVPDLGAFARGLRLSTAVAGASVAVLLTGWFAVALAGLADAIGPVWAQTAGTAVTTVDELGAWWGAPVLAVGLTATALLASRWHGADLPATVSRVLVPAGVGVLVLTALVLPVLLGAPVGLVVAELVAVAVATGVVGVVRRDDRFLLAAVGAAGLASTVALASQSLSVTTWAVVAVVAAAGSVLARTTTGMAVTAGAGSVLGLAAVTALTDLLGAPDRGVWLVLAVASVLVALLAQSVVVLLPTRSATARRLPVEASTALAAVAVLAVALTEGPGWAAVPWTIVGAGLVLVGLVARDRRLALPAGSSVLAVAYVLRLVASDVRVVEAYTLPVGLLLLGAGAALLWRDRTVRTWLALGPGLTLSLLPSLPGALLDPTSLRGLLLTVAVLVLAGGGAALRWQAPFVTGATLATVMVVRHLGPYADALPRWALLAVAGVVLLGVGITWESRVRQARSAVLALGALR